MLKGLTLVSNLVMLVTESFNIDITIQDDKLVQPPNVGKVNKILELLNEDVYKGLISSNVFRTNSRRPG